MKKLLLCGLAAATLLAAHGARADQVGFTTTNAGLFVGPTNNTAGYTFTLANSVTVTQLGFFDRDGDGLTQSIPVTLWNSAGVAQTSATVPAGTGPELNGYRYVTLSTPTTLPAGNYTLGAYVATSADSVQADSVPTGAAGVTFGNSRFGNGNAFPTSDTFFFPNPTGYFGPNFQFVPEPSTWALLGIGAAGAGLVARRRQRQAGKVG